MARASEPKTRSKPRPAGSRSEMAAKEAGDSVETVFRTLLSTNGLLREKMREYFGRFGITGSQWGVLRILHRDEIDGKGGVRLTDIGQRMLITPPSVTGVVNRLERLGWVTRQASQQDQRAKLVVLTAAGRTMIERVVQGHRARVHTVMAGLSAGELSDLHHLLQQLARHLESIGPDTNNAETNTAE